VKGAARAALRRIDPIVAAAVVLGGVSAAFVRSYAFPHFSSDRDEPVYLLQARALLQGRLWLPVYRDLPFFQPWLTGVRGGKLLIEFPPGWPLVLAISRTLTGGFVPALVVVAAATVAAATWLAWEATQRRDVARVAAWLTAGAPMFAVQSGIFVSYLWTLCLGLVFAAAAVRGCRTGARRPFVLAGLALGLIFATRPFDALVWGLPIGVLVLASAWRGGVEPIRRIARRLAALGVGVAAPVVAMLAYNAALSGDPLRFPIEAADPQNRFGFGTRSIMTGAATFRYTRRDALHAVGANFTGAQVWVAGGFLGVAAALWGVWLARRQGTTWALLGLVVTCTVGYASYWGLTLMGNGAPLIGPQYYLPMLAPVVVLGAIGLVEVWDRRRWVAAVAGIALVAITVPTTVDRLRVNRGFAADSYASAWRALDRFGVPHSLVFVPAGGEPYLLAGLPFAGNGPELVGDRLYAVDRAPDLVDLAATTDRTPFRLFDRYRRERGGIRSVSNVERLRTTTAGAFTVDQRVFNDTGAPVVRAYFQVGDRLDQVVLDEASTAGRSYTVRWLVSARPVRDPGDASALHSEVAPDGPAWLVVGARLGDTALGGVRDPGVDAASEVRWAVGNRDGRLTVITPARRFRVLDTDFGRLWMESGPTRRSVATLSPLGVGAEP